MQVERAAEAPKGAVEVAEDQQGNYDHCRSDHVPEPWGPTVHRVFM